ncbi:MAG: pyridoxamine 5'-phosphate oxidase [Pseudomonadota bacterium]
MATISETSRRSGVFSGENPFKLAQDWLNEAEAREPNDANAMALSTVDKTGMPNVRMVLLKEIESNLKKGGFVFYTNYESAKGQELEANAKAALVLHWKSLRRQIRIRGIVEKVAGKQADAYFNSRSLPSRLGAIASKQSRPLANRRTLMAEVAKVAARHPIKPPRPAHWGGFRIRPVEIEFWADGANRLHDRFRWTRMKPESDAWTIQRLHP